MAREDDSSVSDRPVSDGPSGDSAAAGPPVARPVCAVVGVGPGNGAAVARTFAAAGHAVALVARGAALIDPLAASLAGPAGDAGATGTASTPAAVAYACDVTDEAAVAATFARIAAELGPVDTLVYNAGSGVWGSVDQVSAEAFEQAWRVNALGLFLCARQVIPAMTAAARGSIVVIGATASRRGVAGTAAFAPAKMAQKGLAESMARHLGPQGVHVALVVVDGVIRSAAAQTRFPNRAADAFIDPDAVAATVLQLTRQDRSAWTFEIDVRPAAEKW